MVDFHRLNPNALLVLLGTVIYVVVGGPWVVAGGVTIALGLGALHRPRGTESGGDGPMSLVRDARDRGHATARDARAVPAGSSRIRVATWAAAAFGECPSRGVTSLVCRGVAQPGRALGSGPRGRRFKSFRPDHASRPKSPESCSAFLLYASPPVESAAVPVLHLVAHVNLGRHELRLVVELAQANDVAPGLHFIDRAGLVAEGEDGLVAENSLHRVRLAPQGGVG